MKRLLSMLLLLTIFVSLSACNTPTVPADCEGDECEAEFCELNPEDLSCTNDPDDPDNPIITADSTFEDAMEKMNTSTSHTETTTYYSKINEDIIDVILEIRYDQQGDHEVYDFTRTITNDWGTHTNSYLFDTYGSYVDYYTSYNEGTYYKNEGLEIGEIDDEDSTINFSDVYTITETTISTRDYYLVSTTFEDFSSLKTLVEAYYPYHILRNIPLSLYQDSLDELPVEIYVNKDKTEISKIDIDFKPIVNEFRNKFDSDLFETINFTIEYEDFEETEIEVPTEAIASDVLPLAYTYNNVEITYDIYDYDYDIDQVFEHPSDTKLFILESDTNSVHVLDYETMENDTIAFDYKPMTMFIKDDLLYVGVQKRVTQGYDLPESNNGEIIVYNINTLEEVDRIGILYDPNDIVVTNFGQIVVAPATGQQSDMVVYDMEGNIITTLFTSYGLNIYVNPEDNRIYEYAYWDGVRHVYDIDENGEYEVGYRPDEFGYFSSIDPVELYFSPDGYTAITHRGSVLLSINDEELDGTVFYYLGMDVNHVDFDDLSFYVSGKEGVYQFENSMLINEALYSTPLPAIFSTRNNDTLITINQASDDSFIIMKSQIGETCTTDSLESSCQDYEVKHITYNGITLSEEKQAIINLIEPEITSLIDDNTKLSQIRELTDNIYLITYTKLDTDIVIYVEVDDSTSIIDIKYNEIEPTPEITEQDLKSLMNNVISTEQCDKLIGEAYYTCKTEDITPYLLLDNYWYEIEGNHFKYSAVKEGYEYLGVFYEGDIVSVEGELYISSIRVADHSFDNGDEYYIQTIISDLLRSFDHNNDVAGICDGYFINQEQTDDCNEIMLARQGLRITWNFLWDYEESGRNAIRIEFYEDTSFKYIYYVDMVINDEYDILLDFELIEIIDPSTNFTENAAKNTVKQFLQSYYQGSITDYCLDYISETRQDLRDLCYDKDMRAFHGSNVNFFDYETVTDLGDFTYEVKASRSSFPDYHEIYTVKFIFEDNRWKMIEYNWTPHFSYSLEDAETFIKDVFLEVETYNDYEYCHKTMGIGYSDIPDECRTELILLRLDGYRYNLISITEVSDAVFNITYKKESPLSTEIITSKVSFLRGEFGVITFMESITNTIDQDEINGTLETRIESMYVNYLTDLFDSSIDSTTLYNTYINTQYDIDEFITYRDTLLTETLSITINSITHIVDYRYQVYYEISFDITDTSSNTTTNTVKVKIDSLDTLKIAPLTESITYTISDKEVNVFIEDIFDSVAHYYFAPFLCTDYVVSTHPGDCSNQTDFLFITDFYNLFTAVELDTNKFEVSYLDLNDNSVLRKVIYELTLEDGTIKITNHYLNTN